MKRAQAIALALTLAGCVPAADRPAPTASYGGFRNPFPTEEAQAPPAAASPPAAEDPATPPEEAPPSPPPAPAPAKPSNHCGPACGACSRAAEACDAEVRRTERWDGPQCKRKDAVCGALVALKRATGCDCD